MTEKDKTEDKDKIDDKHSCRETFTFGGKEKIRQIKFIIKCWTLIRSKYLTKNNILLGLTF